MSVGAGVDVVLGGDSCAAQPAKHRRRRLSQALVRVVPSHVISPKTYPRNRKDRPLVPDFGGSTHTKLRP